ncbi:MAG: hypothetical protein V3V68_04955 [Nitrosomonadaceae bacterium]
MRTHTIDDYVRADKTAITWKRLGVDRFDRKIKLYWGVRCSDPLPSLSLLSCIRALSSCLRLF